MLDANLLIEGDWIGVASSSQVKCTGNSQLLYMFVLLYLPTPNKEGEG